MLASIAFMIIFTSAVFWDAPIDPKWRTKKVVLFLNRTADSETKFKNLLSCGSCSGGVAEAQRLAKCGHWNVVLFGQAKDRDCVGERTGDWLVDEYP